MSGIYIPWMSMPRTCDDCQVSADCPNDEHIDGYTMQKKPRFCQLVPIPPHGRCIDADVLEYEEAYLNGHYELGDVEIVTREDIESAPTIIPADKGGDAK